MKLSLSSPRLSSTSSFLLLAALACGGKTTDAGGAGSGTTPGEGGGETTGGPAVPGGDAGPGGPGVLDAGPPAPPALVTFVLKNSHTEELAFNMNKGWSTNIFAYSGKPPKAKSILMFPTFCTMACDSPEEGRCPLCEEPATAKESLAAQKFEKVLAGATLEVPWDGQVLGYQKTRGTREGKNKRCQCYTPEPPTPETYTVKACGLRLTSTVGTNSSIQCVEAQMVLPATEPVRIELDFGAPPPPPKKKK